MTGDWQHTPAALRAYADALEGALQTLDATGRAAERGRRTVTLIREEADQLERAQFASDPASEDGVDASVRHEPEVNP